MTRRLLLDLDLDLDLDLGGGDVRCLLLDSDTGDHRVATRAWTFPAAPDTFGLGADLELEAIWDAIAETCRDAMNQSGDSADDVAAIGVSALRFGNVILAAAGESLFAVPNRDAPGRAFSLRLPRAKRCSRIPARGRSTRLYDACGSRSNAQKYWSGRIIC